MQSIAGLIMKILEEEIDLNGVEMNVSALTEQRIQRWKINKFAFGVIITVNYS